MTENKISMKGSDIKSEKIQPDYELAEKFIIDELKNGLSSKLTYHGYQHTLNVLAAGMKIADSENISDENRKLLRIGILFHDSGFLRAYDSHEERGCDLAREYLPGFGFSEKQIKKICGMIMATKVPQRPKNKLDKIICDADLDYLGRDDVERVSKLLYEELRYQKRLIDKKDWNEIQIDFLRLHRYHTKFSQELRGPKKLEYLNKLIATTPNLN